jgi:hypothetical protein
VAHDPEDLAAIEKYANVRIETHAAQGAVHRTTIWAVVEDGAIYVRTFKGAQSRWYREAVARPNVALHAGKRRIALVAVPAADSSSIAACNAGLSRKYKASYSLGAMLREDVLGTTLRLDPA